MKILASFLLFASMLCVAQSTIHDVSGAGSPLALNGTTDAVTGKNVSSKEILFFAVVLRLGTSPGQDSQFDSAHFNHDYYFKPNGILPRATESISHMTSHHLGAALTQGTVEYVQFVDGSSWGDSAAGAELIVDRQSALEMYGKIIAAYSTGGGPGMLAFLNGVKADAAQSAGNHADAENLIGMAAQNGVDGAIFHLKAKLAAAAQHDKTLAGN